MTVLELVSEHLPQELAAIVTGYVIRQDWRPFMNEIIERFYTIKPQQVSFDDSWICDGIMRLATNPTYKCSRIKDIIAYLNEKDLPEVWKQPVKPDILLEMEEINERNLLELDRLRRESQRGCVSYNIPLKYPW